VHQVEAPATVATQVPVFMFQTTWKLQSEKPEQYQSIGSLYIGTKEAAGVPTHCVYYKSFHDGLHGAQVDLSHTVTAEPVTNNTTMRYHKKMDPTSPWTFTIDITDFGDALQSKFTGTLVIDNITHDWQGECQGKIELPVTSTKDNIPKPAGLTDADGTISELTQSISAIAAVGEGKDKDALLPGQDGAQYHADKLMVKLMMHALNDAPVLPPQEPLDANMSQILSNSRDFFERAAVHMLSEQIKTQSGMDQEIAKHIKWKYSDFMKMVASPKPKPAAAADTTTTTPVSDAIDDEIKVQLKERKLEDTQDSAFLKKARAEWDKDESLVKQLSDPVWLYGLDATTDAVLIQKLKDQFQAASMACYDLGYRRQEPKWEKYLKHPDYWFRCYQQWLLSDEHMNHFAAATIDTTNANASTMSAEDQVRALGNKLSLLKHAAQNQNKDSKDFDVEHICDTLHAHCHEKMAYMQVLSDDLVKESYRLTELAADNDLDNAFKKQLEKEKVAPKEATLELLSLLPHALNIVTSPKVDMGRSIGEYWSKRMPGGRPARLTVGQAAEGIEMADFSQLERRLTADEELLDASRRSTAASEAEAAVPMLKGSGKAVDQVNKQGRSWLRTVGKGASVGLKVLFRASLYGAGIFALYSLFAGDRSKVSTAQMGTAICASITTGVSLITEVMGKIASVGRVMNWCVKRGGAVQTAHAWLTGALAKSGEALSLGKRAAVAFLGGPAKFLRTLAIVGCVFSLVTSFWGMNAEGDPNDPNVKNERYFSKWYFGLGVIELAALGGGLLAEILGFELGVLVAGPLGLAVAAIGIIVMLVQMFFFPPDPFSPIRDWMKGMPHKYGSYDGETVVTGEGTVKWPLPKEEVPLVSSGSKEPDDRKDDKKGKENRKVTTEQAFVALVLKRRLEQLARAIGMLDPNALAIPALTAFAQSLNGFVRDSDYTTAVVTFLTALIAYNAAVAPGQAAQVVLAPNNPALINNFNNLHASVAAAINALKQLLT